MDKTCIPPKNFPSIEKQAEKLAEALIPDLIEFLKTPHYTFGGIIKVDRQYYYYKISSKPELIDDMEMEVIE